MKKPIVFQIQKYSIHDGDGIRTTVFFKGCPLWCKWCHNPESQYYWEQLLFYREKCVGCGRCVDNCPHQAIRWEGESLTYDAEACMLCKTCIAGCYQDARSVSGRTYEVEELVRELEKDRMFYEESGGGITLSGGEVMAQNMEYIEILVKRLHQKGYSVAIDTCGAAPYENFKRILPYVDTFLYDIKLMDNNLHMQYTGQGNELVLENIKRLNADGAGIYLRLPLISKVNDDDQNMICLISFLRDNQIVPGQINLLPYHNIGKAKYVQLFKPYEGEAFLAPSQERLEEITAMWRRQGYSNVKIGG